VGDPETSLPTSPEPESPEHSHQSAVGQKIPETAAHFSCNEESGQEPHPPPMAIAKKDNSDIFMDQSMKWRFIHFIYLFYYFHGKTV
jgi:hypothetical protein